jgi:hypothetical protein
MLPGKLRVFSHQEVRSTPAIAKLMSDRLTSLRDHLAIRLLRKSGRRQREIQRYVGEHAPYSSAPPRLSFPFDQMNHRRTEHARFPHRCLQVVASHE